jgi:hypothetical protein
LYGTLPFWYQSVGYVAWEHWKNLWIIGVNDELKAMSSSSSEEIPIEQVTQEIREQQIVRRFDFGNLQNGPQRGAVILHFWDLG